MSLVFAMWTSLFLIATLAVNLKWAGVDPHNISAGPSWRLAALSSAWIVVVLWISLAAQAAKHLEVASFLANYAFGSALGPSISTPYRLTEEEEPVAVLRYLEGIRVGLGGTLMKALAIGIAAWSATQIGMPDPSFWLASAMALMLGLFKAPVVMLMLNDYTEKDDLERLAKGFLGGSVVLACLAGTIALAMWIAMVGPIIQAQIDLNLGSHIAILGFLIGLVMQPK